MDSFSKCRELILQAEEAIVCPCCFEISDSVVQCVIGHHICKKCQMQLNNKCPSCKNSYPGTKCFVAQNLGKMITEIKTTFDNVIFNDTQKLSALNYESECYQGELSNLLSEQSIMFKTLSSSLSNICEFIVEPTQKQQAKLYTELTNITKNLKDVELKLNTMEKSLKILKNNRT